MNNVIEFNNVWKKFRKGERFNSIRDAVPCFFRRTLSTDRNNGLSSREFWALKDVSFEIAKGEVLGIIGPNGAGKSTILKLLSRIMLPNKGNIEIQGRLSALIEITAGFHNELTGKENIYLNGTILGMRKKEIDNKFDKIVEFSGLEEFIDTPVKRYSSGMYSRLGFSVAVHMDPDILLVDEVLAVGDISFQSKCAQKMRELLSSGATIVLVSHNLALIQSLCKKVVLLDRGKVLKEGSTNEVISYYQDIVYKKTEEEFRKKVSSKDYMVELDRDYKVNILDVFLYDGNYKSKEDFKLGEKMSINITYEAKQKIEAPIFHVNIIRSDGVLCCALNTADDGFKTGDVQGKGEIKIDLGKINLAPGIYRIEICVWDREMVHPYIVRKKDIFRIESTGFKNNTNVVFLPKVKWERLGGRYK